MRAHAPESALIALGLYLSEPPDQGIFAAQTRSLAAFQVWCSRNRWPVMNSQTAQYAGRRLLSVGQTSGRSRRAGSGAWLVSSI